MSGLFITFEGGDGAGKSTQTRLLIDYMQSCGHQVLATREPGGTGVGRSIRELLLHTGEHIDPRAEALLYAADRAQNINTQVRPALERGVHVVQDRYIDSSVAYQGAGRQLNTVEVQSISDWATSGLTPDLTVLLDLDPNSTLATAKRDGNRDRIESAGDDFRARLRAGFLQRAVGEPERFLVIRAQQNMGVIHRLIRDRVDVLLSGWQA